MINLENYSCIEFSGLALHPTFSIYLFEIAKGEETFFYIGMTGDGHYPSARSILHRLAGHIDLGSKSTQSQFITALKKQVFKIEGKLTAEELASLHIKLHHWAIPGFETWEGDLSKIDKNSDPYIQYKAIQTEVLNLEKRLIGELGSKLLNNTKGNASLSVKDKFQSIYQNIKNIVAHG
jgi:hypothetical protein